MNVVEPWALGLGPWPVSQTNFKKKKKAKQCGRSVGWCQRGGGLSCLRWLQVSKKQVSPKAPQNRSARFSSNSGDQATSITLSVGDARGIWYGPTKIQAAKYTRSACNDASHRPHTHLNAHIFQIFGCVFKGAWETRCQQPTHTNTPLRNRFESKNVDSPANWEVVEPRVFCNSALLSPRLSVMVSDAHDTFILKDAFQRISRTSTNTCVQMFAYHFLQ